VTLTVGTCRANAPVRNRWASFIEWAIAPNGRFGCAGQATIVALLRNCQHLGKCPAIDRHSVIPSPRFPRRCRCLSRRTTSVDLWSLNCLPKGMNWTPRNEIPQRSHRRILVEGIISHSGWPTCEARRSQLNLRASLPLVTALLAVMSSMNARASDSAEILSIAPPTLAFARYIAFLNQRSPFTESGPVALKIDASLPRLGKQACLSAIRQTGASERSEYQVLHVEGDSVVKHEVIARYLSAQAQADAVPLSSALIIPANYKFHYVGSIHSIGTLLYVFQVSPRKKRVGLIQGHLWIDPVTGVAVHQAGHFVKTPSVLLHRIDITRDTNVRDGFPYIRITHVVVDTRLPVGPAELTITERPVRAPDGEASLQVTRRER
jgi:hypothetical protein